MDKQGWRRRHEGEVFMGRERGEMIYTRTNDCDSRGGVIEMKAVR